MTNPSDPSHPRRHGVTPALLACLLCALLLTPAPTLAQPRLAAFPTATALPTAPSPLPLTVVGWNVGLDDADPAINAAQLAAFEVVTGLQSRCYRSAQSTRSSTTALASDS